MTLQVGARGFGLPKPYIERHPPSAQVFASRRPNVALAYEHMFSTTHSQPAPFEGFTRALADRLRGAARLALAFLTLEDGHEPDWPLPEEPAATRPPACGGRVRQPGGPRTAVGAPWINA